MFSRARVVVAAVLVGVSALTAFAVAAPAAPTAAAGTAAGMGALEAGVLAEMNALRQSHGLPPLRVSRGLAAAATAQSRSMAAGGFFRHESADGSAFWQRVRRFYGERGFGYWAVGENLLWSSPDVNADGALRLWLDSAPHRKNLLTERWREVGIAAVHVAAAPGVYGGREVTIVTADFGVRK